MRITGLSNQWGERLLEGLIHDEAGDRRFEICKERTLTLLQHLTTIDGPDLWVGTSHSLLNFCARDTNDPFDRIPPLAYLESLPSHYRISYDIPREFRALPDSVVVAYAQSVEDASKTLLVAIASSDANPNRYSAEWNWFVCPKCDFHSLQYAARCRRCSFEFPPENKVVAIGLYRRPRLPDGAIAPNKAVNPSGGPGVF